MRTAWLPGQARLPSILGFKMEMLKHTSGSNPQRPLRAGVGRRVGQLPGLARVLQKFE